MRGVTARTAIAMALAVVTVAATLTVTVLVTAAGVFADFQLIALAVLTMAGVGTLLSIRVPRNAIGWLLLISALCLGIEIVGAVYLRVSETMADGTLPGTAVAAWLYSNLLFVPVVTVIVAIPLIYPDGRLLSARWRWLAAVLVFVEIMAFVKQAFRPGLIPDTDVMNPFGIAGVEQLAGVMDATQLLGIGIFIAGPVAVALRYRRADVVVRQQLKWLIAATALAVGAWSIVAIGGAIGSGVVTTIGWYLGLLSFTGLPIAIGIAVLRSRLYEIDRIISRTIAWALVTGVLLVVFAGGVIALQTALIGFTQGETLAVAVSTLIVAALFQPLRGRVQRAVDRRFDRASYDARRTVEAFTERLRGEMALDAVTADLEQTVASAVKPSASGLWLRPTRTRPNVDGGT
jgi:hypothetical protein